MPPPAGQPAPPGAPLESSRRPGWATAIGVISIVLAGIGLICVPTSTLLTFFFPLAQKMLKDILRSLPDWYRQYLLLLTLIDVVVSVILLIAASALLRRRPLGRTLHLAVAVVQAVVCVIATVIGAIWLTPIAGSNLLIALASAIGSLVLGTPIGMGLPYPIFLLIWFNRAKIKQQVSAW